MSFLGLPVAGYNPSVPWTQTPLRSQHVRLTMRQEPKEALVTQEGKEKLRKPIDPPPIIQMELSEDADPFQKHYLSSPYLFMCCTLWHPEKDHAWEGKPETLLAGSLVSSIHKLKDINNRDGGFFVFGDVSVKVKGTFRLRFSLFDLRKDDGHVVALGEILSAPFQVLPAKQYKGLEESTYLSRAFSDQGVRLRLRKEPSARKRAYSQGGPATPGVSQEMRHSSGSPEDHSQYSQLPLQQPAPQALTHSLPPPYQHQSPQVLPQYTHGYGDQKRMRYSSMDHLPRSAMQTPQGYASTGSMTLPSPVSYTGTGQYSSASAGHSPSLLTQAPSMNPLSRHDWANFNSNYSSNTTYDSQGFGSGGPGSQVAHIASQQPSPHDSVYTPTSHLGHSPTQAHINEVYAQRARAYSNKGPPPSHYGYSYQ